MLFNKRVLNASDKLLRRQQTTLFSELTAKQDVCKKIIKMRYILLAVGLWYPGYLLPFELLCRILKARIKDSALSSFSSFNKKWCNPHKLNSRKTFVT